MAQGAEFRGLRDVVDGPGEVARLEGLADGNRDRGRCIPPEKASRRAGNGALEPPSV
jgi:hypothetical protein